MTKKQLIEKIKIRGLHQDPKEKQCENEKALIEYINDKEIKDAYDAKFLKVSKYIKLNRLFKKILKIFPRSISEREMENQFFTGVCENPNLVLEVSGNFINQYLTMSGMKYYYYESIDKDLNKMFKISAGEMHNFVKIYYRHLKSWPI